jgi:hypothetical protein
MEKNTKYLDWWNNEKDLVKKSYSSKYLKKENFSHISPKEIQFLYKKKVFNKLSKIM